MEKTELYQFRQQFPALTHKVYFNFGGQGPMSHETMTAIANSFAHIQSKGPFSKQTNDWVREECHLTRTTISSALGVEPTTISLTEDVSVGCNIVLWGLDWQAGDHLLMTDCEHPGIIAAIQELQRRMGLEVTICPISQTLNQPHTHQAILELVQKHLRPRTRLVVLSHIFWNTGQVLPLDEIVDLCHSQANPVRVLVDAAQSVGMIPLNLTQLGVDFYAFTGHKWWCGPEGLGGLYVSPEARERLSPTFIGWRNLIADPQGNPVGWQPHGQRYEIATSAYPLYAGLRESLNIHNRWGTDENRYQRILSLSRHLWQQLQTLPTVRCVQNQSPQSGLVSLQLLSQQPSTVSHAELVQVLEDQGILIRAIPNPNCVRVSIHYFTLESEINTLVRAIARWSTPDPLVENG